MTITSLLLFAALSPAAAEPVAMPLGEPVDLPLECQPQVIAAFKEAWDMAGRGRRDYEAAFRVDPGEDGYDIEFMPMTREPYQLPVQYFPKRTLLIAHTHPDTAEPTPGPGDYASKVPNFVVSRSALYVTIPGTKTYRLARRDWRRPCV